MMNTDFKVICGIMAEIWTENREDARFARALEFGDLGYPFAYAVDKNIVEESTSMKDLILGAWDTTLGLLDMEDIGYRDYNHFLSVFNGAF